MKNLTLSAIVLVLFQTPGDLTRERSYRFRDVVRVEKITDSYWWHCEFVVNLDGSGTGSAALECRYHSSTVKKEKVLEEQQVEELRDLLRRARLFEGQFWGKDFRGDDGALITLSVLDGERYAILVCSQNQSFDFGFRKQLMVFLDDLREKVEESQ